jgi:hypothetical protein
MLAMQNIVLNCIHKLSEAAKQMAFTDDLEKTVEERLNMFYHFVKVEYFIFLCYIWTGKPATQESSLDVFCHVIFDVNIDVMDVRGRPQEFVAL